MIRLFEAVKSREIFQSGDTVTLSEGLVCQRSRPLTCGLAQPLQRMREDIRAYCMIAQHPVMSIQKDRLPQLTMTPAAKAGYGKELECQR